MDRTLFIDAAVLERRPFQFETTVRADLLDLADGWTARQPAGLDGVAELLDREGLRAIRVRGRLRARLHHACDRCLKDLQREFDDDFDLYFYPMEAIQQGGETAVTLEETEVGFYEDGGVGLDAVAREQLLLWLPARSLCDPGCKGLCPVCGVNRNAVACGCRESLADPRWDALRHLKYRH